jgi:hypothetical protein
MLYEMMERKPWVFEHEYKGAGSRRNCRNNSWARLWRTNHKMNRCDADRRACDVVERIRMDIHHWAACPLDNSANNCMAPFGKS